MFVWTSLLTFYKVLSGWLPPRVRVSRLWAGVKSQHVHLIRVEAEDKRTSANLNCLMWKEVD